MDNFIPDSSLQASPGFYPDPSLNQSKGVLPPDKASATLGHSNSLVENMLSGAWGGLKDVATGVAKGGTQTALGIGSLGQGLEGELGSAAGFTPAERGETGIFAPSSPAAQQARQELQPTNAPQAIGKGTEQLAEYAAPTGVVGDTEKAIGLIPKIGSFARGLLKMGTEAATGAGVSYAQTLDPKEALTSALTFGALKGGQEIAGTAAKAIGLPEHLYSTVFRTAASDMENELKSGGIQRLQKESPELFKEYVKQGIIKTGADGQYTVDKTLARQALDRGLKGSISNMASTVVRGFLKNESEARSIAQAADGQGKKISISSPEKLISVLQTVANDYQNVGQGEVSQKAQQFIDVLKKNDGQIDATTGLSLRRFLDGMRRQSSYNPEVKLSTTAQNFKYWSDNLRTSINQVPGMKKVMSDYKFNIDALEALGKTAAKQGNAALVNMLDVLVFEGGLTQGMPGLGAGLTLGRKALQMAGPATSLGSAIEHGGTATVPGMLIKGGASQGVNAIENSAENQGQEPQQ